MAGRIYVAIDLKSFYASSECVEHGFPPLSTHLVVADQERTDKTICLAVSPSLKSFGIPDYPGDHYGDGTRTTERSYHLNLEVRLHNGAMKTFEFDVTDQVKAQPRGGVIIVSDGLVITDEEGAAGSDSGFDIDVEGWGDYIDIPLPL